MANNSYQQELARKLIHLSSLWIPAAIYFLERKYALALLAVALIGMLIFEILRRHPHALGQLTRTLLGPIFRRHESASLWSLTGATLMLAAALICAWFFPKEIAAVSMMVLIVSDTAAALIGRALGRPWLFGKSISGCAAFFACTLLILDQSGIAGDQRLLIVSALLTAVELFSAAVHLDDNLSIPLSCACLLTFL